MKLIEAMSSEERRKRTCPRCGIFSSEHHKPAVYTCANCGATAFQCCFNWGSSKYCPPCAAEAERLGIG